MSRYSLFTTRNVRRSRCEREQQIVEQMIRLYCRRKEGNQQLCSECESLIAYTAARLHRCPFGESKKACQHCSIHCYSPQMRQRIRLVMRYSGPRMLFVNPWAVISHWFGR